MYVCVQIDQQYQRILIHNIMTRHCAANGAKLSTRFFVLFEFFISTINYWNIWFLIVIIWSATFCSLLVLSRLMVCSISALMWYNRILVVDVLCFHRWLKVVAMRIVKGNNLSAGSSPISSLNRWAPLVLGIINILYCIFITWWHLQCWGFG